MCVNYEIEYSVMTWLIYSMLLGDVCKVDYDWYADVIYVFYERTLGTIVMNASIRKLLRTWILNWYRSMLIVMMRWMSNEYAHICVVMPLEEMLCETVWWEEMIYDIWCKSKSIKYKQTIQ